MQREVVFARKPEGLTFIKQPVLQANLQPNIVYKQKVFQSLSQLPLTALFTKESRKMRIYLKYRFIPEIVLNNLQNGGQ